MCKYQWVRIDDERNVSVAYCLIQDLIACAIRQYPYHGEHNGYVTQVEEGKYNPCRVQSTRELASPLTKVIQAPLYIQVSFDLTGTTAKNSAS